MKSVSVKDSTAAGVLQWTESELPALEVLEGPTAMVVQLAPNRGQKRPHVLMEWSTREVTGILEQVSTGIDRLYRIHSKISKKHFVLLFLWQGKSQP